MPRVRQSKLGRDGHPALGGFLPPVDLPRRMWAGGRLEWLSPLRIGEKAQKTSTIKDVQVKQGKTGPLVFVTVRHTFSQRNELCIREEHDIVYRDYDAPGTATAAPQPPPTKATFSRSLTPDPVLLFRYSALTFNGHRIHYDRSFCVEEEGYPGLVFHGPLSATLLIDLLRDEHPELTITAFNFRAVRPVFDTQPLSFHGAPTPGSDGRKFTLWVEDHTGALSMTATAEVAPYTPKHALTSHFD